MDIEKKIDFGQCGSSKEAIESKAGQLGLITVLKLLTPHKDVNKYFKVINSILDGTYISSLSDKNNVDELILLEKKLSNYLYEECGDIYINSNMKKSNNKSKYNVTTEGIQNFIISEIYKNKIGLLLGEQKYESELNVELYKEYGLNHVFENGNIELVKDNGKQYIYKCGKDKYIYIDKTGTKPIKVESKKIFIPWKFKEGFEMEKGGKCGFVKPNGDILLPFDYDKLDFSIFGKIKVYKGKKLGLYNKKGKEIIPCEYTYIKKDDEYTVMKNDKYGILDEKGKEIIPCEYTYIRKSIYDGYIVANGKKYGFLDEKGKEIVYCEYSDLKKLSNGSFDVKKGKKLGLLDKGGKEIVSCEYDKIEEKSNGCFLVQNGKKYGFLSKEGVIPCTYEGIKEKLDGNLIIKQGLELGVIDKKGNILITLGYYN